MHDQTIKILLVEDNRADIIMLQELLSEVSTVQFEVVPATLLSAATTQLKQASFDVILLDLSLPDAHGLETIVQVQAQAPSVPIVVMTGLDNEELAVDAVRQGAQDYLVKGQVNSHLLVRAIRYAIERKHSLEALRDSEERFRLLVAGGKDYAIFTLAPNGCVMNWNAGAQRTHGYPAEEIIGQDFSCFYVPKEIDAGKPQRDLQLATAEGRFEEEGWRVRQGGLRFWAAVSISTLRDESGQIRGFAQVTRDLTERQRAEAEIRKLHEDLKRRAVELEFANKELEAFNYSVSHDLRNPLSVINGFSALLLKNYSQKLGEKGQNYLQRIHNACKRMEQLIEDLLLLSRISRTQVHIETVQLSSLVQKIALALQQTQPQRQVEFRIAAGVMAKGDGRLLEIVLENLLGNAWKYTGKKAHTCIEFGTIQQEGQTVYFVRDNGAGFSMADADKLFYAFQRLHQQSEFEGTGIGLATVQRIIHRHGGKIWAEAVVDAGATFYFTLAQGGVLSAES